MLKIEDYNLLGASRIYSRLFCVLKIVLIEEARFSLVNNRKKSFPNF